MDAAAGGEPGTGHPSSPQRGLGLLYQKASDSFTDLRRSKLTQLDVLRAAPPLRSLHLVRVLLAASAALLYACCLLPHIREFGSSRWRADVRASLAEARPGGPFSEVSLSYAVLLSLGYVALAFLGVTRMAQRPAPVQAFVFECAAVHNAMQCLFNLHCLWALLAEGRALGLCIWGNPWDASERSHTLGGLLWLQYHCRQLQLLETAVMVLQKKFHGISFLHIYLRVLNLWGWFIACRCVCGGEAYFPAVVSAACQALVYGVYFSFSLLHPVRGAPADPGAKATSSRAAWVFRLQIAQYVICAVHSLAASAWGNFPASLAALHIFVIGNGLVLYTDFHSQEPQSSLCSSGSENGTGQGPPRVTFSFDSCGWLMVYHFGVGAWISEHLGLEAGPEPSKAEAPAGVAFSGSSGGSLISCVLAAGICVRDVFDYLLEQFPLCRKNPFHMFPAVELALRKFQYEGAHKRISRSLRILLTRVTCRPPFVMGEVADSFPDVETAVQVLCASCHVPLVAGLLPRRVAGRYYYDGLMWPSRMLVPWRGAEGDHVVRITAAGVPLADIRIPRTPFWWAILPPRPQILRGIFWCGYRDAAAWVRTKPSAPFELCGKCRRPAQEDAGGRIGKQEADSVRWQAVQRLVKLDPSGGLPERDPRTGEDVAELIALAEALAEREMRAAARALAALFVAAAALLLAVALPLAE